MDDYDKRGREENSFADRFEFKNLDRELGKEWLTNNDDWGGVDYDNDGDEEYVYDEKYRRGFPSLC